MGREIQQIQYINDLKRFNVINISKKSKDSIFAIYHMDEKIQQK